MSNPPVAVLMSTYNGEKYLIEQINSILDQSYGNIHLFIRDDGSTDRTLEILKSYLDNSKITIFFGQENLGYKNSFLKLLSTVIKLDENYQYFSFSDQDDVWLEEKVERGVRKISETNNKYSIYFSNLIFVDEKLEKIKVKNFSNIETTLGSELVRHSVSGATSIFTRDLALLASDYENIKKIPGGHDAFIFRLNAAIGGSFVADTQSFIKFRRHTDNTSRASKNFWVRMKKELDSGDESEIETAKYLSQTFAGKITEDAAIELNQIINYKKGILSKATVIFNRKFRRESKIMNLIFVYKILFNKL